MTKIIEINKLLNTVFDLTSNIKAIDKKQDEILVPAILPVATK